MGKYRQISTELWPLIALEISFHSLSLEFYLWQFLPIFFKLGIKVDIGEDCLLIADG